MILKKFFKSIKKLKEILVVLMINFMFRVLSSLVLAPLFLWIAYINNIFFHLLLLLIFTISLYELKFIFIKKINLLYLFSSRDEIIDNSLYFKRGKRALINLLETLPIFILLIFLSINKDIDNLNLAALWLVFRAFYLPIYILGINFIRTFMWFGSLVCLIMMGLKLL